jgi:hypothetical protein
VEERRIKRMIEDMVEGMLGVEEVNNQIRVQSQSQSKSQGNGKGKGEGQSSGSSQSQHSLSGAKKERY